MHLASHVFIYLNEYVNNLNTIKCAYEREILINIKFNALAIYIKIELSCYVNWK